ncbi:unnamed protein product, partial [marine sediment metagenome]
DYNPGFIVETGTAEQSGIISVAVPWGNGIIKFGDGRLVLSAANNITKSVHSWAGILELAHNGAAGTRNIWLSGGGLGYGIGVTISNDVQLGAANNVFDVRLGTANQSGIIYYIEPVVGTVEKTGAGTLILSAANTYIGGTTITGGTLQIGNAGTTGSIPGDVLNNANLAFNRSDNITFGGDISGSGGLTKLGTNLLTLRGTNTYAGATNIQDGTLQIGDGGMVGSIAGSGVDNSGQ